MRCAERCGIGAIALSACYAGKAAKPGLVPGFDGTSEETVGRAAEDLAEAIVEAGSD